MLWVKFWFLSWGASITLWLCWSHLIRTLRRLLCPCWVTCLRPALCSPSWVSDESLKEFDSLVCGYMSSVQIKVFYFFSFLAKEMLPHLTEVLKDSSGQMGNSDETVAGACSTMLRLMSADSEGSKKLITSDLVNSLIGLSENGWFFFSFFSSSQQRQVSVCFHDCWRLLFFFSSFPKSSNAASVLLHSMWNDKNLQSAVKKVN